MPHPVQKRVPHSDGAYFGVSSSQRRLIEVQPEIRRGALRHLPTPHPVRIELYTDNVAEVKQAIAEEIGVTLADQQLRDETIYICADHQPGSSCVLEIVRGTESRLVALLPESAGTSIKASAEATQARRREISRMFAFADRPTGALVTLPRYDLQGTSMKRRDPKEAIRLGLAETGRVSQFMAPDQSIEGEEGNYAHRLKSAVRDLLYTLGYRLNPFYENMKGRPDLPDQLDILSFAVIQLNARNNAEKKVYLPLALLAPSGSHALQVFLPRDTGDACCYTNLYEGFDRGRLRCVGSRDHNI